MAFKNVTISGFRGIKHCEINNLGKRVNLFVGKNNCGKTSVLEAVFLLTGMSNTSLIGRINIFRECAEKDFHDTAILNFYQLAFHNTIEVTGTEASGDTRQLHINAVIGDKPMSENEPLSNQPTKIINNLAFDFRKNTDGSIVQDKLLAVQDTAVESVYVENILARYFHTKAKTESIIPELASMLENKEKGIVLECLAKIEPRIKDITIIEKRILVDIGLPKLLPIQVLGDGIRKMLSIIVCIYSVANGILIIDEIDNGVHFSSMPTLWKTVLSMAERFNVQVFATTHNIDALIALKEVLEMEAFEGEQEKNTTVFRLRRTDEDDLIAYAYDYEKFEYAIEMEHEIR